MKNNLYRALGLPAVPSSLLPCISGSHRAGAGKLPNAQASREEFSHLLLKILICLVNCRWCSTISQSVKTKVFYSNTLLIQFFIKKKKSLQIKLLPCIGCKMNHDFKSAKTSISESQGSVCCLFLICKNHHFPFLPIFTWIFFKQLMNIFIFNQNSVTIRTISKAPQIFQFMFLLKKKNIWTTI